MLVFIYRDTNGPPLARSLLLDVFHGHAEPIVLRTRSVAHSILRPRQSQSLSRVESVTHCAWNQPLDQVHPRRSLHYPAHFSRLE